MSSYCKECSIEMFGKDFEELAGLSEGDNLAMVLCESCGWILVNSKGEKVETLNNIKKDAWKAINGKFYDKCK